MSITVNLPPMFRHLAGTTAPVAVSGGTIGECLREVISRYPALKDRILGSGGGIRPGVVVIMNGESIRPGALDTPVEEGDTLYIAQMVLGG